MAARRVRAATWGSPASVRYRTTTKWRAPAPARAGIFSVVTPPVTNTGTSDPVVASRRYSRPVPGRPGLVGVGSTGPAEMYESSGPDGSAAAVRSSGPCVEDGVGAEQAAGERNGRVVLADVDAVGGDVEGEVGPIIEDERHAAIRADRLDEAGPRQKRHRLEMLLTQLHDVDPAGDAGLDEPGQVRAVGCAEVEVAVRDGR
jgi:hypothetical protein